MSSVVECLSLDEMYSISAKIESSDVSSEERIECYGRLVNEGAKCEGSKERQLASQLISRYFHKVPSLSSKAFTAVARLCVEDRDPLIRRQALHDLPALISADRLNETLEVLLARVDTADSVELALVHKALLSLLVGSTAASNETVLRRLFKDISIHPGVLSFLKSKVMCCEGEDGWVAPTVSLNPTLVLPLIRDAIHRVPSANDDTFFDLFELMNRFPNSQTLVGRRELVDLLSRHSGLVFEYDGDERMVRKVLVCLKRGLKLFSKNVPSNKFADFLMEYACPKVIDSVSTSSEGGLTYEESIAVMRNLADMTAHYNLPAENISDHKHKLIFDVLNKFLVDPAAEAEQPPPDFDLSMIEASLFLFHFACNKRPKFLTQTLSSNELRQFKLRLQFLGQATRHYIRQLMNAQTSGKPPPENQIVRATCNHLTNIEQMVKDFFHPEMELRSQINVSWHQHSEESGAKAVATPKLQQQQQQSFNRYKRQRPTSPTPQNNKRWRGGGGGGSAGRRRFYRR